MFRPRLFQPFSRRAMRHAATVLALVLLAGTIGAAAPRLAGDLTPGKLPKSVVPTHYAIDLELNPETLKVDGFEVIDIEVREPTARIVLNADEITITRASIDRKPRGDPRSPTTTMPKPSPSPSRDPLEVGTPQVRIAFTGANPQVGARPLLRRLPHRQRQQADDLEPSRPGGRPPRLPVLGRAGA